VTSVHLGPRRAALLLGIFLLSGATSLVYQILWVRVLSLTLGSTVFAISLVISAFMAGLALGSAWLGRRADARGGALRTYAWLELGIGVAALVLPVLFGLLARAAAAPDSALGDLVSSRAFAFVASFLLLLVPTTLMGGTLPVLSRYVAAFSLPRGLSIGALYTANTVGAIVGTAITGFVLIRVLGIQQATLVAAVGNILVFGLALFLAGRWPDPPLVAEGDADLPTGDVAPDDIALLGPITIVYALNGFTGLALEVLWTRAIVLFSANTIYAFTVILTTFLVGIAVGSAVMSAVVPRLRRVGPLIGGLQCAMAIVVGVTPFLLRRFGVDLVAGSVDGTPATWLAESLGRAYLVAALFMLPPTLLMGATFPLVARVVAGATSRVGRAVGRIYALNTVGAVAGSLLAGFVVLPWLGIQGSILAFALVAGLAGLFLVIRARSRGWIAAGAVGTVGVGLLLVASPNHFRILLEEALDHRFTFYEEGIETTVAVYDSERAARPVLVINNTALDDRGVVHKLLVHLPMMVVPDPQRALVLGFGVGISNESLASHNIAVNDCVEISPSVMNAAPFFASLNGNIAHRGDPSFTVHVEDGRKFLLAADEPYDLIVLDANSGNLRNAGVGKLYTRDFFELCRSRLAEDGMVTLYVSPNGTLDEFTMITRTFLEVFEHTTLWVDRPFGQTCVLMGGLEPLRIDLDRYLERFEDPQVVLDLAVFDLDQPGALLACFVAGSEVLDVFTEGGAVNTDDHPVMEFFPLKVNLFAADDRLFGEVGFPLILESVVPYLEHTPDDPAHREILDFVSRGDESFPSVVDGWVHRWNGNTDAARSAFQAAAGLHPEAEYLRTLLGYGRRQRAERLDAAEAGDLAARIAAANLLLRRDEHEAARDRYEAILAAWTDADGDEIDRAQVSLGAGRAARERGDLAAAREHLTRAHESGVEVLLDLALLDLAAAGDEEARTEARRAVIDAALNTLDVPVAVRTMVDALGGSGLLPRDRLTLARALEALGDPAGAHVLYQGLVQDLPTNPAVGQGQSRTGAELGLRVDLFRRALGSDPRALGPLRSPFLDGTVAASQVPPRDYRSAAAWLELADHYLRARRAIDAYRAARAARTVEPDAGMPYAAIAQTAYLLQSATIAERALAEAEARGVDPATLARARAAATQAGGP
jgi:spermidine synthase